MISYLRFQIPTLFGQRPIVEKHAKYAFYHPFSEAVATMICDLPKKIASAIFFNVALYFITGLRPTASCFFIFTLFAFMTTLCMSMFFRAIGSTSRTHSQAMVPSAVFLLALVLYTGFTIPTRDMVPWFRWLAYINPGMCLPYCSPSSGSYFPLDYHALCALSESGMSLSTPRL